MAQWQSYPDFAHLFDALLQANGISAETFARQYTEATGKYSSSVRVFNIQSCHSQPVYEFVEDIADHGLLSLDPNRLGAASDTRSAGDYRLALFTTAGFIEVTPASIAQWNEDIIAGWQRRLNETSTGPKLNWRELMHKLLDFHTQGGRCRYEDIANTATSEGGTDCPLLNGQRLNKLITGNGVATQLERLALGGAVGLTANQIQLVESAIDDGTLALGQRLSPSSFSSMLQGILDHLRANGISQKELALRSIRAGYSEPDFCRSNLSAWKYGRTKPTFSAMRGLICGLERCHPLVTQEEIVELVSAAGFTRPELAATTHNIVSSITAATRLKPLLAALRNAADLDVPMSAVTDGTISFEFDLKQWENDGGANSPSPVQLSDLLTTYNHILRTKGHQELDAEEISKIAEVARRDREDGMKKGFIHRALETRPSVPCRAITPDFDGGQKR
jgi:hypothetical protein